MLLPENKPMHHDLKDTMAVWVMGAAGEGKTTFASTWPNPILINTDGNYRQFSTPSIFIEPIMNVNGQQIHGFNYLEQTINELIKQQNKENGYQTIIIDLLEDVIKMCEKMVAKENGKESIQDIPWGRGFKEVAERMRSLTTKLNSLNMNVIYLSHMVQINAKDVNGNDTIQFVPKEIKNDMVATIAGRVQLMCALITYQTEQTNANGEKVKVPVKLLYWEKSALYPSVVQRFNTLQKYCVATYSDLIKTIKGEK